jgi:hypothetical protein
VCLLDELHQLLEDPASCGPQFDLHTTDWTGSQPPHCALVLEPPFYALSAEAVATPAEAGGAMLD